MPDKFSIQIETERFQRFTRHLIRDMPQEVAEPALRKTAFDFLSRVIPRTPVDTGRARAGWTSYLIAKGQPMRTGGSSAAAQEEGRQAGFFTERFGPRDAFVLVGNAVRYILPLEFGWSKQAAAGFFRITMREMRAGRRLTKELSAAYRKAIIKADIKAGRRRA